MSKRRWSTNGLALWSVPLLLALLLLSLANSGSHRTPSIRSVTPHFTAPASSSQHLDQNALAGVLTNANPQLMVPVPHPGRWYLQTSNSTSAELVCPHFRSVIDQAFVESASAQCQVVLIALHLPTQTAWKLVAG